MTDDADTWERRYDEHARGLFAWLVTQVGRQQAEDCLQEVWMKALKAGFPGGHFRGWLFTIARRHLIDRSRSAAFKRDRQTVSVSDDSGDGRDLDPPETSDDPDDESCESLARLAQCLERLDVEKRAVVTGWLSDRPYRDLARELGLAESQIAKRFDTAKGQLRRCLEGDGS